MAPALQVLILLLLGAIAFQDFKTRYIHWVFFPLLAVALFVLGMITGHDKSILFKHWFLNSMFIGLQLLIVTILYALKNRRLTNIVNKYIGLGDVLLFIALAVGFSQVSFIIYFLVSSFTGLLFVLPFAGKSKHKSHPIPLAGVFSLTFSTIMLVNLLSPVNLAYNDNYLLNLMLLWT